MSVIFRLNVVPTKSRARRSEAPSPLMPDQSASWVGLSRPSSSLPRTGLSTFPVFPHALRSKASAYLPPPTCGSAVHTRTGSAILVIETISVCCLRRNRTSLARTIPTSAILYKIDTLKTHLGRPQAYINLKDEDQTLAWEYFKTLFFALLNKGLYVSRAINTSKWTSMAFGICGFSSPIVFLARLNLL